VADDATISNYTKKDLESRITKTQAKIAEQTALLSKLHTAYFGCVAKSQQSSKKREYSQDFLVKFAESYKRNKGNHARLAEEKVSNNKGKHLVALYDAADFTMKELSTQINEHHFDRKGLLKGVYDHGDPDEQDLADDDEEEEEKEESEAEAEEEAEEEEDEEVKVNTKKPATPAKPAAKTTAKSPAAPAAKTAAKTPTKTAPAATPKTTATPSGKTPAKPTSAKLASAKKATPPSAEESEDSE